MQTVQHFCNVVLEKCRQHSVLAMQFQKVQTVHHFGLISPSKNKKAKKGKKGASSTTAAPSKPWGLRVRLEEATLRQLLRLILVVHQLLLPKL